MRFLLNLTLAGTLAGGAASAPYGIAPVTGPVRVAPARPAPADTVREYRGQYETGFEVSWFHPCEAERGDDTWWVTLTDDALRQRDSLAARIPAEQRTRGAVFVRWRGTISTRMPAGQMGRGSRYMLVSEVLDVRPGTGVGCATT